MHRGRRPACRVLGTAHFNPAVPEGSNHRPGCNTPSHEERIGSRCVTASRPCGRITRRRAGRLGRMAAASPRPLRGAARRLLSSIFSLRELEENMSAKRLTTEHKAFVVQALARFETPKQAAEALNVQHGATISPQDAESLRSNQACWGAAEPALARTVLRDPPAFPQTPRGHTGNAQVRAGTPARPCGAGV